ncbi:MAG: CehA/McbA family metallohydrolase [bacterium]
MPPRRMARLLAPVALALLVCTAPARAAVFINEIMFNPVGTETGVDEKVEIYNSGPNAVNMTGWAIDDAVTIGTTAVRARIPEDLDPTCSTNPIIQPGEFRVVRMQVGSAVLNNGGDDVYLLSNRTLPAVVVQLVTYPAGIAEGQVWACLPNGTTTFAARTATLCASNGGPVGDVTPPGTVSDLVAVPGAYPGEVRLTWTAPGDDGATGTATSYVIKVSSAAITSVNFAAALDLDRWIAEPTPKPGAAAETLFVFGLAPDTTWHFALQATDEVPNTSGVSNDAATAPAPGTRLSAVLGYSHYYGNLHSHTSLSDGVQTPAQAYAFARFTAPTPLDFLAVTDHNHSGAGMSLPNYAVGATAAATANADGDFVAIWGQEWGVIATGGHANVFEAPVLFGWEPGNHDVFVAEGDYTGLYTAFRANPPAAYPPVVSWCHPSGGDYNSYAVTADGNAVVRLFAMVSGPANSTAVDESDAGSSTGSEALFQDALRKGHRVSPTGDQDNHNATWGASTQARTALLASGRTKSQILQAMAARRAYATTDHNTRVEFSADGHAMGEAWSTGQGIRISAHVTDPDLGAAVERIELLRGVKGASNAQVVARSVGSPTFQWRERTTFAAGTEAHYYLRIRMSNNATVWTGPVYVTYDPSIVVGVEDGPRLPTVALLASPNPAFGRVTASFALPTAVEHAELSVYDAAGRRVNTLLSGPLTAGTHRIEWAGHDESGRVAPAGIFFLRLQTGRGTATTKVLLVR